MNILSAQHQQMMMAMKAPFQLPCGQPFATSSTTYDKDKALMGNRGRMQPSQQQHRPPTTPAINGTRDGNSMGQSTIAKFALPASHVTAPTQFSGDMAFLGIKTPPSVIGNDFCSPLAIAETTTASCASVAHPTPPVVASDDGVRNISSSMPVNDNSTFTTMSDTMFDYVESNLRAHPSETMQHSHQDFNDLLSHLLGTALPPSDELFDDDMSAGDLTDVCDTVDSVGAAAMMDGPLQVADDGMLLPS